MSENLDTNNPVEADENLIRQWVLDVLGFSSQYNEVKDHFVDKNQL